MCLLSFGFIYNALTECVGESQSVWEQVIYKKQHANRKHNTGGEFPEKWRTCEILLHITKPTLQLGN